MHLHDKQVGGSILGVLSPACLDFATYPNFVRCHVLSS